MPPGSLDYSTHHELLSDRLLSQRGHESSNVRSRAPSQTTTRKTVLLTSLLARFHTTTTSRAGCQVSKEGKAQKKPWEGAWKERGKQPRSKHGFKQQRAKQATLLTTLQPNSLPYNAKGRRYHHSSRRSVWGANWAYLIGSPPPSPGVDRIEAGSNGSQERCETRMPAQMDIHP